MQGISLSTIEVDRMNGIWNRSGVSSTASPETPSKSCACSVFAFNYNPYKAGYLSSEPSIRDSPPAHLLGGRRTQRRMGAFILKHVIPSSHRRERGETGGRAGWNGTWTDGRTEGGKADRAGGRASELRESEIPVGMVPVICVMVPGL